MEMRSGEPLHDDKPKTASNTKIVALAVSILVLLVGLGIGLGLYFGLGSKDNPDQDLLRIDCFPERPSGLTQEMCEGRGCVYELSDNPDAPPCYMGEDSPLGRGYSVIREEQREDGLTVELEPLSVKETRDRRSTRTLGDPVPVTFNVQYHGPNVVRIKVFLFVVNQISVLTDI